MGDATKDAVTDVKESGIGTEARGAEMPGGMMATVVATGGATAT